MTKINYNLFVNRKRFNIYKWIKGTKNNSYEDLCLFLNSRDVESPDKAYFKNIVKIIEKENKQLEELSKNKIEEEKTKKRKYNRKKKE